MDRHNLKAEKRTVAGKKVKNLRHEGFLPANIYGKNVTSEAVQVNLKEFQKVYKEVGETGLVDLEIDGGKRPILIHNLQFDPITGNSLHADFYQVNLKEKITSAVPLEFVGEPEAVANKVGVLLTLVDEVEVEALPADLPENIPLDVSKLKEIDEELKVSDLIAAPTYNEFKAKLEMLTDPETILVKIGSLVSEEAAKEAAADEAAKAAAAAEAGAAPAEGSAPAAEASKPEAKKEE